MHAILSPFYLHTHKKKSALRFGGEGVNKKEEKEHAKKFLRDGIFLKGLTRIIMYSKTHGFWFGLGT